MSSPSRFISGRSLSVDASGIRKVFDLAAKMKDPINFSIGLPDFDVPDVAKQAAIGAIQSGHNRYTQTQGIAPLRERLRRDLSAEIGRDVGEVLITSGVSGGLFLAMLATIDPGDEAIFLDPYFVMYKHLLSLVGGKSVIVDSYPDFRFRADRVEKVITPRTKLLILNSPSNPTGVVMSREEVADAVELAQARSADRLRRDLRTVSLRSERRTGLTGAIVRKHLAAARVFEKPRDDRLAAGLCRGSRAGDLRDDEASAVHVRVRAQRHCNMRRWRRWTCR